MASTNLDFNIIAKTGQALGEIRLLKAQIQDLGRSLRAAVKAGDTAGAQTISQNIGRMEAQLRGLNRTLDGTAVAGAAAGRSMAISARSFRSFEGAVLALGKSLGGLQGGLAGLGATLAGQQIGKLVSGVVEDLTKVQQLASNTRFSPATIQALGQAMLKTGLSVDQTQQALQSFSKASTEARLKAGQLADTHGVLVQRGDSVTAGMVTLTGATTKFVEVLRGGATQAIKDFSDPLGFLLGADQARFRGDPFQQMVAAAQRLQELKKNQKEMAAGFGGTLFGPDWDKYSEGLAKVAKSPAWAQLQAQAAILTGPEAMQRMADYNAAWGALQIAINSTIQPLVIQLLPELTQLLNDLKPAILTLAPDVKATFSEIIAFIQTTKQEVQGLIDLFNYLVGIAKSAGDFATRAASTMSGILPGTGNAASAMPFASGGMVRGPGNTTSDSILARLSNGEFVMSAGAVQRWGAGLLASMNGGGALIPRNGRYAAGGLVAAGGGTPVHLHLGGHSFALSGNDGVVSALVTEAHRHRIRSAGTKPSWYGGTPGR